jgi:hypothetical protein
MGVDRAALDFAIGSGIAHGGWCPKGRLAIDGPLDALYREAALVAMWLKAESIKVLNIAGPREEKRPGIYAATMRLLSLTWAWYGVVKYATDSAAAN